MDTDTLNTLKREFDTSSWAMWSDQFPNDGCVEEDSDDLVEYMISRSDRLKPWIVLLGLNRSTKKTGNYENFHSTEGRHNDDVLRLIVEKSGFRGAYMTDIARVVEKDGRQVELEEGARTRFLDQLELLSRSQYHVICFGNEAFSKVKELFDGELFALNEGINRYSVTGDDRQIEFFSVRHYSQRRTIFVVELCYQMQFLGDEVIPLEVG